VGTAAADDDDDDDDDDGAWLATTCTLSATPSK
jgi:hypothetical protein